MSTIGVWRAVVGDEPVAVKRLAAPGEHDPSELSDPHHFAYWRRGADVVTSGILARSQGLRPPVRSYVVEDVEVYRKGALARQAAELFSQEVDGRLVLLTCEDWDGTRYLSNVVVTALPVADDGGTARG